ncbi:hypothetical protein NMG60_11002468 [Bertholletia excelsa]
MNRAQPLYFPLFHSISLSVDRVKFLSTLCSLSEQTAFHSQSSLPYSSQSYHLLGDFLSPLQSAFPSRTSLSQHLISNLDLIRALCRSVQAPAQSSLPRSSHSITLLRAEIPSSRIFRFLKLPQPNRYSVFPSCGFSFQKIELPSSF